MKTLADEIIERTQNNENNKNSLLFKTSPEKSPLKHNKVKPKSAGNKSFRLHNSLRFMRTFERSEIGKENNLKVH